MVNWGPIEICFIVDLGDPMHKWLEIFKKVAIQQAQDFADSCRGYIKVKVAFIGYRTNIERQPFVVFDFTSNLLQLEQKINLLQTYGPHQCKSMRDAYEYAINLDWQNYAGGTIIHMGYSPPHGIKYHDQTVYDIYPSAKPPGIPLEMLIERLAFRGIHIIVFQFHESMDMVVKLMEKAFNETKRTRESYFRIINTRKEYEFNNELLAQIYMHLKYILDGN